MLRLFILVAYLGTVLSTPANESFQEEFIDPCSQLKCSTGQICISKDETTAFCANQDDVQLRQFNKRQLPTFCGTNECRFGECEVLNSTTFICHCQKGITGENCNKLDKSDLPCSSNPCHGDSVCINLGENYVCVCGHGRTGQDCRDHVSPCQCQNGGICVSANDDGTFRCKCSPGYGGYLCQFQVTPFLSCKITGCLNNGVCTVLSKCQCPEKYTGFRCESLMTTTVATTTTTSVPPILNINVCYVGICQNGGTCHQLGPNFGICICASGYSGPYCTEKNTLSISTKSAPLSSMYPKNSFLTKKVNIQLCPSSIPNPCQNDGKCGFIESTNTITCTCPPTYQGPFCNTRAPFCEESPCKNGATCNQIGDFEGNCTCTPNFTGLYCDISLTCDPNPCKNNQPCLVVNGVAKCFCASRFRPPYCD